MYLKMGLNERCSIYNIFPVYLILLLTLFRASHTVDSDREDDGGWYA